MDHLTNGHLWCYNNVTAIMKTAILRAFDNSADPWLVSLVKSGYLLLFFEKILI